MLSLGLTHEGREYERVKMDARRDLIKLEHG